MYVSGVGGWRGSKRVIRCVKWNVMGVNMHKHRHYIDFSTLKKRCYNTMRCLPMYIYFVLFWCELLGYFSCCKNSKSSFKLAFTCCILSYLFPFIHSQVKATFETTYSSVLPHYFRIVIILHLAHLKCNMSEFAKNLTRILHSFLPSLFTLAQHCTQHNTLLWMGEFLTQIIFTIVQLVFRNTFATPVVCWQANEKRF